LAYLYGRTGQPEKAHKQLVKLQNAINMRATDPAALAVPSLYALNKEQALAWLEKAYKQHSNLMTTRKVEPAFDPLRSDPRFKDLQRRVGLER
jgi:hypothetical protein